MQLARLKILPILIFVCLMAFSMRLVSISDGITEFSQPAVAQEAEEAAEGEEGEEEAGGGGLFSFFSGGGDEEPTEEGETVQDGSSDVETSAQETKQEDEDEDEPQRFRPRWVDATDSDMEFTDVKIEMFQDLATRRKALEQKEKELATREALLSAAEQELDRKFQELAVIRSDIENLLERQSEQEKERIKSLVSIYEGMKAQQAARIFDTLDLDILVTVLSQMTERKVSPILAAMNPERARTVTIMLAEQKQLPSLPNTN